MSILKRVKLFFWARRRRNLCLVVDTNFLLRKENWEKLARLKVCIPVAVWQEINLLYQGRMSKKGEEILRKTKLKERIEEMIKKKKWVLISSAGTGIVKMLEEIKIKDLDIDLTQIKIKFRKNTTLKKLLGVNDIRVLAAIISLKNPNCYLLSYDKLLILVAEALKIKGIDDLNKLNLDGVDDPRLFLLIFFLSLL